MKHVMRPSEGGIGAVLYETARRGSYALLDALLRGGVSPFECDPKGNTALHYAVRRGHVAMCKRLVAAGADAEVANMAGASSWDLALQCGHAAVRRIFSPSASDRDLSKPPPAKVPEETHHRRGESAVALDKLGLGVSAGEEPATDRDARLEKRCDSAPEHLLPLVLAKSLAGFVFLL